MVKPKKSIEELREAANVRAKRYQQAQRDQGRKHLSAMVSQEVFDIITRQRERTGATVAQVLEQAVVIAYGESEPVDLPQGHEATTEPQLESVVEDLPIDKASIPEPEVDRDQIPNCHGRDLTTAEKDSILIQVVELYPGRENAQKRADVLNHAGVPCGRGTSPWDAKKVMDNYRNALKRRGA